MTVVAVGTCDLVMSVRGVPPRRHHKVRFRVVALQAGLAALSRVKRQSGGSYLVGRLETQY